jgi:hypothetical protein
MRFSWDAFVTVTILGVVPVTVFATHFGWLHALASVGPVLGVAVHVAWVMGGPSHG